MGEYILYRGEATKIGTCEELYYTSFRRYIQVLQNGHLSKDIGSDYPENYTIPNYGYRFRFPFPDEDHLPFGEIENHSFERGLLITIARNEAFAKGEFPQLSRTYQVAARYQPGHTHAMEMLNPNNVTELVDIELVQQKLVVSDNQARLVLVYRCPFSEDKWRIEDFTEAKHIADQIEERYVKTAAEEEEKLFWQQVTLRILQGYQPVPIAEPKKPLPPEAAALLAKRQEPAKQ
jgi:hypothetical protein